VRKSGGNFVESACLCAILKADTRANSEASSEIPLLNRTGNFCERTGEYVRENREFEPGVVRSDFQMTFS
jgi:hypothetical protein